MEKRDFKGVWIPKEVWLDERLNALEKIILVEIDSLDCEESGCYASNEYLAEFCQCSVTKVSLAIKKLITLGYIYTASFDGRTRLLKSRLSKNERQPYTNSKADLQKVKHNNININNKENNKVNKVYIPFGEYGRVKLTQEQYDNLVSEHNKEYIDKMINALDEYIQSNDNKQKYKDFNLVLKKCIRENWFKIEEDDDPHGDFQMLGETDEEYRERMRKKEEKRKRKVNGVF